MNPTDSLLNALDALDGAIQMLNEIAKGKVYSASDFHQRVRAFETARDEHHEQLMKDARNRRQIRDLAAQRRGA